MLASPRSALSVVSDDDYDGLSSDCFSETGSEGPIGPLVDLVPLGAPTMTERREILKQYGRVNIARERMIAAHMIGSAQRQMVPPYMASKPPPIGRRTQNRYFNDHHFGNRAATASLDELMEHMQISVDWKSNFEKLARPENEAIADAFRSVKEPSHARSNGNQNNTHRARRTDSWHEADDMFTRIDRRARAVLAASFEAMHIYIQAIEDVIVHFVKWNEVISSVEIVPVLANMLSGPMTVVETTPLVRETKAASSRTRPAKHKDTVLVLPLVESSYHRLLIHAVCQFYGLHSQSHYDTKKQAKIMRIRRPARRHHHAGIAVSLCDYLYHTQCDVPAEESSNQEAHEDGDALADNQSVCSDDSFCVVAADEVLEAVAHV
ncbi:hypothetical protein ACHHYP_05129 [Achlya hypogyna]|uniref:Uncharacterized protein n=1 Tax=Achlya hypogyna TaxID=1202772 RepID=A0A1V9YZG2_ACHHY|nr:hypothetical protein ACHHYP_05129 [Achlya hypogyna]